uniref:SP110 nuclear body protein n=1 Tax=Otolemur garnettii TaxID=30611 RepID=H0XUP2_OTOGA
MITVTRALEEALLQHFIYKKVEIAYAICKPFPFFESLRDKSFITNRMYNESLEACSNLVPVSRVVHNILTKLEKTFSVSLLMTLFSQINLHEYPNLEMILQSFKDETLVGAIYGKSSRATPILLEVPTGSAQGCSLQMLPPPPPSHPPHLPRGREPKASLQQREAPSSSDPAMPLPGLIQEGSHAVVTEVNLTSKMNEEEDPQETPSPAPTTVHVSRDKLTPKTKHEGDPQETPHTPSSPVPVIGDESLEPNDLEETQKVPTTPSSKKGKKRKRNTQSSQRKRLKKRSSKGGRGRKGEGGLAKLAPLYPTWALSEDSTYFIVNTYIISKLFTEGTKCARWWGFLWILCPYESMGQPGRKMRTSHIPTHLVPVLWKTSPGHGIKEKLQVVDEETQRKDDSACNSKIMTRAQKARAECAPKSRSKVKYNRSDLCPHAEAHASLFSHHRKKPQDDTMDFPHPIPVTCGKAKGILYLEKIKLGTSGKFIQNEEGVWLTPTEFVLEGKERSTNDWKKHVYFRGESLRKL